MILNEFFNIIETLLKNESISATECEEKVLTTCATITPKSTSVTTTAHNSQASKYYKGRPIQSQPRTTRDGNSNSYHR